MPVEPQVELTEINDLLSRLSHVVELVDRRLQPKVVVSPSGDSPSTVPQQDIVGLLHQRIDSMRRSPATCDRGVQTVARTGILKIDPGRGNIKPTSLESVVESMSRGAVSIHCRKRSPKIDKPLGKKKSVASQQTVAPPGEARVVSAGTELVAVSRLLCHESC